MLDAAVGEATVDAPEKLVHARAHELVEETLDALARQGISKETYLQIAGRDEETLAHEAQPEAEKALKREAVLAAIVEAEQIEPTDEQVREALEPSAESGEHGREAVEQLRSTERLHRVREEVADRMALELLVAQAKPISVEQAQARNKLWTPGKEPAEERAGALWTPGS